MHDNEVSKPRFTGITHSFDIHLATQYGLLEALLLSHFAYWIDFNKRSGKNNHDSRTWTYQTLDEISTHFPYFSKSQIFDALKMLCTGKQRKGKGKNSDFSPVLLKGNFNLTAYDRTIWYAFIDEENWLLSKSKCILLIPNMEKVNSQNGNWELTTPIPDSKTYSKEELTTTKDNTREEESQFQEQKEVCCVVSSSKNSTEEVLPTKEVAIQKSTNSQSKLPDSGSKAKEDVVVPKEVVVALLEKVDKKFDGYMLSEAERAIETALKEYPEHVVLMSIEDLNQKEPDSIHSLGGLFYVICKGNSLKPPRKIEDVGLLEKRMMIARCLEKMPSNGGCYNYDDKKLYENSGCTTKEYAFRGNDYFWEKKEMDVKNYINIEKLKSNSYLKFNIKNLAV